MKIISYSQAKEQGLKRYFTGKPCKRGHIAERITSSATCMECGRLKDKERNGTPERNANRRASRNRNIEKERARDRARSRDPKRVEKARLWKERNRARHNAASVAYTRKRLKVDPEYRLIHRMRRRVLKAVTAECAFKSGKTAELLGCSGSELRAYLESLFKPGMSWENYGYYGWHVDHIRPCASFDLTDPEEQKKCFHFSNLQPLWMHENRLKSDHWEAA